MCIRRWHVSAARSTLFFSLFALFKTTKSHENFNFLYPFPSMAISPPNNDFYLFYTGKLYGLTGQYEQLRFDFLGLASGDVNSSLPSPRN